MDPAPSSSTTPPGPEPTSPPWRRPGLRQGAAQRVARQTWERIEDSRAVVGFVDVSAKVSNNRVFRLTLNDAQNVFIKVSNYGSYFLFLEDNDRVLRLSKALSDSRFAGFLAEPMGKNNRMHTYYDGEQWAIAYNEVERRYGLPPILSTQQIANLAEEIALFHTATEAACQQHRIPTTSTSIRSDAVNLLDRISTRSTARSLHLSTTHRDVVRRHTEEFLFALHNLGYDDWPKLPVLIDWNMGNFSVTVDGNDSQEGDVNREGCPGTLSADDPRRFRLFSRWDYDWFRTENPMLDFYFLSRVSSSTGDRTTFTYGAHTLTEERFLHFVAAYHRVRPLTEQDIRFLPELYRFFILHYVVAEGDHFFRSDLWLQFQIQAVEQYLPSLHRLDLSPLLRIID